MSDTVSTIYRSSFDTAAMVAGHPPRFSCPNKRIAYRMACPPGCTHSGLIGLSRWRCSGLPAALDGPAPAAEAREDYFTYGPPAAGATEWHLNFAHSDLFCAYGGALFAQDEMQVAEHPALGSLREALLKSDLAPLTVEAGEPTPVLVTGVERRCRFEISPDTARGRPDGLYGNHFYKASADAIVRAVAPIRPPTITNLIAMEAPPGGAGTYTREDVEYILRTAFAGFTAARLESARDRDTPPQVVVHTGFWGCGAYGGHRVLMALLQLIAARLARLDRLVIHTGDRGGTEAFANAGVVLGECAEDGLPLPELITRVEARGFRWGVSDGN